MEADIDSKAKASTHSASVSGLVNARRSRFLAGKTTAKVTGPVLYWCSRDQRHADNWALLYASAAAKDAGESCAVVFNLVPEFMGAGARHWGFMVRGLRELESNLKAKGIPFFLLKGDPKETLTGLVKELGSSLLVTDYSPLKLGRRWRDEVAQSLPSGCSFVEVDAHNVVPAWIATDKKEIGARTLRPKIHKHLPEFLTDFPPLPSPLTPWPSSSRPPVIDWDGLLDEVLTRGSHIPEVTWCIPGESKALEALASFLAPARLKLYAEKRNDPCVEGALSGLSPYLHYGQLSPQRAALEAAKRKGQFKEATESFLEELIVRRELSDNFCHYEKNYDQLECGAVWAQESLEKHRSDPREFLYSDEQFETAKTHDDLWNAAQRELVELGKMHGFLRMYWAKKILEWTPSAAEAIRVGIMLNDRYSLDGRDPSGYVGVMWSCVGIHDMGWTERAVFGKIRYMNYAGCKRKFKIAEYISLVAKKVKEEIRRRPSAPSEK